MTYEHSLAKIAAEGRRYDHPGDHINLALAERVEALVDGVEALVGEMAKMNGYLAVLVQINPKMDALVAATKARPLP